MKFLKTLFIAFVTTTAAISLQAADLNVATIDPQAALLSTNFAKKEIEELENSDEWKEVIEELQAKANEAREIQEKTQKMDQQCPMMKSRMRHRNFNLFNKI